MRLRALILGDMRFQRKYGFYLLYAIFSVLYLALLYALPGSWQKAAALLLIFTDPAAMGLYFMGSIVLLERSERVLQSLAISPMRPMEYVQSKLITLGIISTMVALFLCFGSSLPFHALYFPIGVFLGSCIFSSAGLVMATRCRSLNSFILLTIPAELLISLPGMAYLFGFSPVWSLLHPGACIAELLANGPHVVFALAILLVWAALMMKIAEHAVGRMLKSVGGIKL